MATRRKILISTQVAGASVDDNVFSVSIHWRGVAEADLPRVAGAVDAVLVLASAQINFATLSPPTAES